MRIKIILLLLAALAELELPQVIAWVQEHTLVAVLRDASTARVDSGDRNGLNPH